MKKIFNAFDVGMVLLMLYGIVFLLDFSKKPLLSYTFVAVFILLIASMIVKYVQSKKQ
jgi:hypothetical protein